MRQNDMPLWKEHFPISWVDDHFVTRREFTKSLVWVSFATCMANGILALLEMLKQRWGRGPLPQRPIARVGELAIGGSKVFQYPHTGDPCVLVRIDAELYTAFGQKCTHLGCPVYYRAEHRQLHCPCHEGFFAAEDGRVLAGPPLRPLRRIVLEKRGQELWAIGTA